MKKTSSNLVSKFLVIIFFALLLVVTSPLRQLTFWVSPLISSILLSTLTAYLIHRYRETIASWQIMILGIIVILLQEFSIAFFYYPATLVTAFEIPIHMLAVIAGYFFWSFKTTNSRLIYSIIYLLIMALLSILVYQMWIDYAWPISQEYLKTVIY